MDRVRHFILSPGQMSIVSIVVYICLFAFHWMKVCLVEILPNQRKPCVHFVQPF